MAKMLFREPNEVRWVGTRPAHRGTQVVKDGSAANATTLLYTVTAAKTLYLTGYWIEKQFTAANCELSFYIRNAGDVLWYRLIRHIQAVAATLAISRSFSFPLEVPAGYDLILYSSAVGGIIYGGFEGWEE